MNNTLYLSMAILLIFYFVFSKERNKDKNTAVNEESKRILNELLTGSYDEKILKIVDFSKDDVHNIKAIQKDYALTVKDATEFWTKFKKKHSK